MSINDPTRPLSDEEAAGRVIGWEEERAAIVAWLDHIASGPDTDTFDIGTVIELAAFIKSGEHRK